MEFKLVARDTSRLLILEMDVNAAKSWNHFAQLFGRKFRNDLSKTTLVTVVRAAEYHGGIWYVERFSAFVTE